MRFRYACNTWDKERTTSERALMMQPVLCSEAHVGYCYGVQVIKTPHPNQYPVQPQQAPLLNASCAVVTFISSSLWVSRSLNPQFGIPSCWYCCAARWSSSKSPSRERRLSIKAYMRPTMTCFACSIMAAPVTFGTWHTSTVVRSCHARLLTSFSFCVYVRDAKKRYSQTPWPAFSQILRVSSYRDR